MDRSEQAEKLLEPDRAISRWWLAEGSPDSRANSLWSTFEHVVKNTEPEIGDDLAYLGCYQGITARGALGKAGGYLTYTARTTAKVFSYNVTRSCVDTVAAKVAGQDVKITALTEGGNYPLQQRAKALDRLLEGVFYLNNCRTLCPEVFRDGGIMRFGAAHIYEPHDHKGSVRYERVFPGELLVDPNDGQHRNPRQMFRRKLIPRDTLLQMYKGDAKARQAINEATAPKWGYGQQVDLADMVVVVEAWHLPSGPKAKDGKHIIAISNFVLLEEDWQKPYFPFAFLRYQTLPYGFAGSSLVGQLYGQQQELDRLVNAQQRGLYLSSAPFWYIQNSSAIPDTYISNEIGRIVRGETPNPPTLMKVEPVSEQVARQIENLVQKMYNDAGVSQLDAASQKPTGLHSGEALQTMHDIGSERFAVVSKAYEQFHLDLARQTIDLVRNIYKRDGKFSVKVPGSRFLNSVDWSQIDLENDTFSLKVFPTAMLPRTPEGRFDMVQSLLEAGFIEKPQALSLLDFPDLDAVNGQANAPYENIQWAISRALDDGEMEPPEPFQDLQLGLRMFTEAYLKARREKVPEDRLRLLRAWISQAQAMLSPPPADPNTGKPTDAGAGVVPPPPPGAGAPTLGQPGPAPTSPLLPTAPQ